MQSKFYYHTDIGEIGILADEKAIIRITFGKNRMPEDVIEKETDLIKEAATQLKDYLSEKRKSFDLPLAPEGTDFMKSVWEALVAVPYGEVRSYKAIAEAIGKEKSARAVGNANNRNPIPIIIPCHRIVGAKGDLVGYFGGLEMKKQLLNMEKRCADI